VAWPVWRREEIVLAIDAQHREEGAGAGHVNAVRLVSHWAVGPYCEIAVRVSTFYQCGRCAAVRVPLPQWALGKSICYAYPYLFA
jgi:hypothetical protein